MAVRVAVEGVSAAGKTTLAGILGGRGFNVHCLPQEHSCVRDLAMALGYVHVVVLDAEFETVRRRRAVGYGPAMVREERRRLGAAIARADAYVRTDRLTPLEVADIVDAALRRRGVEPDRRHA